jgi:hypothetical protein
MGGWDSGAAATSMAAALGIAAYPSISGVHLRLGSTAPTAPTGSGYMTELVATGYTAGGLLVTWATPTGTPALTSNTSVPLWTNSGTTPWAVTGAEIWTTQATPVRQFQGVWAGAPLLIPPGDELAPAAGGLILSQS